MADDDMSYDYKVPGKVPDFKQVGPTCWAAAGAMMISWRNPTLGTISEAIAATGSPYTEFLRMGSTLLHSSFVPFLKKAGLTVEVPRSYSPQELYKLMVRYRSPLLVHVYWNNRGQQTHSRVLTRISGVGTNPYACQIEYNDSLTGPGMDNFPDFYEIFEAAARQGVDAQVAHY